MVSTPLPSASPAPALPNDWPTYGHDAQRTSFNPGETSLSAGAVSRLAAAWQVDVGTSGIPTSGTPSVANGRVFVGSSVATGNNFFAFDAASGAQAWGANLNYTFEPVCDPEENVGIPSTSAISGSTLVVGGGDRAYYGLDAGTGAILWRHSLDVTATGFAWSSPAIGNGRAYVGVASRCDGPPARGEVRALDLATGRQVANQFFVPVGTRGAGVWNSPALTSDDRTLVVATGEDDGTHGLYEQAIVALDAATLAIQSANKQGATEGDLDFASTPVLFHDATGRTLVGACHKNGAFYAFDLATLAGGPIWQRNVGEITGLAPAYDPTLGPGGALFFGGSDGPAYDGGNGQLHAVDPATGVDLWPPVTVGAMAGNVAIANRLVFVNTGPGGLLILDETSGRELRRLTPAGAGPTFSGVAVAGGTVYWLSGSALNAWRIGP